MVRVGDTPPDFARPAVRDGSAARFELFRAVDAGEAVVLLFYPVDFVPTCTAALAAVREAGWADHSDLTVVGIRSDSLYAAFAYADEFGLPFPLVADFAAEVAESYRLLATDWEAHPRVPRRAAVVIDRDWTVRFREATRDALDRTHPAPVENATAAVRDLGIDVRRPRVNYDGPW